MKPERLEIERLRREVQKLKAERDDRMVVRGARVEPENPLVPKYSGQNVALGFLARGSNNATVALVWE
jgi:hypothetical protein